MSSYSRVALVTGANKGIGFAIARELCRQFSGDVVLTARDVGRGQAAVQQLQAEGLSPRFHQLDIDDPQSIRALRDFLRQEYGGLNVLVNNAGIAFKGRCGEEWTGLGVSRGSPAPRRPSYPGGQRRPPGMRPARAARPGPLYPRPSRPEHPLSGRARRAHSRPVPGRPRRAHCPPRRFARKIDRRGEGAAPRQAPQLSAPGQKPRHRQSSPSGPGLHGARGCVPGWGRSARQEASGRAPRGALGHARALGRGRVRPRREEATRLPPGISGTPRRTVQAHLTALPEKRRGRGGGVLPPARLRWESCRGARAWEEISQRGRGAAREPESPCLGTPGSFPSESRGRGSRGWRMRRSFLPERGVSWRN